MPTARALIAALFALLASTQVAAGPAPTLCTWSGATNGDWSEPTNWSCVGGPVDGVDLEFPDGATTFAMNDDIANLTVNSLTFSGTGGGYTLTGTGNLAISGATAIVSLTAAPNANTLALTNALTLGAATALFDASGATGGRLNLNGPIALNGNLLNFVWSSPVARTVINGVVSGNGAIETSGGGSDIGLVLAGDNSFTGPVTVTSGYLQITHAHGLGAGGSLADGTSVAANGTLRLAADTTDEYLTLAAGSGQNGNGMMQADGVHSWGGPVILSDPSGNTTTFNLLVAGVVFGGAVTGGGGFSCCSDPAGKIGLGGSGNTYSGPSNFNLNAGGTLQLLADDALSPNSALVLGGTAGGTLDMGTFGGNAASFTGSAVSKLKINASETLTVQGDVSLAGTALVVTVDNTPPIGTVFTIVDKMAAGAIGGTFGGLPEGALVTSGLYGMTISYVGGDGNDVTLTVVIDDGVFPPQLVNAVSRKVHGVVGTFDLPLSLVPSNPTTEPRLGPAATVVLSFDQPISAALAAVSEGTGIAAVPTFDGNDVIVELTGVTDVQYLTVTLTGVTAAGGGVTPSASVRIGFLAGDVNQTRNVTVADVFGVNNRLTQLTSAANYLFDVNASGSVTLADKLIVNNDQAHFLPAP